MLETNNLNQLFSKVDSVWYEKYRPQTLDEMILPEFYRNKIQSFIHDTNKLTHLGLFSRAPGTGKSSLAKVILNELQGEALWINASLERGIDVLRSKIQKFVVGSSLDGRPKIVVLDEFDHFTKDGQVAFRGFIDQFGDFARFIFTGNYKDNIIEPLLDRLEIIDFGEFDKAQIIKQTYQRLIYILEQENIKYQNTQVVEVIKQHHPCIRKMIGVLNSSIIDNELVLENQDSDFYDQILESIKNKNIEELTKQIYTLNNPINFLDFLRQNIMVFQDTLNNILLLGEYQYKHYFARDKHLNILCLCLDIIKNENKV